MKRLLISILGIFFCGSTIQIHAGIIGKLNQAHWSGTNASVFHPTPTLAAQDSNLGIPNVESSTEYENTLEEYIEEGGEGYYETVGEAQAYTSVRPYGFNGYNSVSNFDAIHAGGFFRDEIYFETFNGTAGSLEFDFNIHFTSEINEESPDAAATLTMNLMGYSGDDVIINDPNNLPSDFTHLDGFSHSNDGSFFEFNDIVTLSTNANGDLLLSGSYIPLSFTLWTDTNDGYVDWFNTVMLDGIRVYDENGDLLDTSQYTLLSENDEYFEFTNQMPASAVPLPPAILLLGSVLAGLTVLRRKATA